MSQLGLSACDTDWEKASIKPNNKLLRDPFYAGKILEPLDTPCPFGDDLAPYWAVRRDLFSLFDNGIQVDREGLHSVKFERAAIDIAEHLTGSRVLDAFCGIGGVSIGLARAGKQVIAVDNNAARLEMARNNARVYGVADRITFVQDEAEKALATSKVDAVYLDPPWGGARYIGKTWFRFSDFSSGGLGVFHAALQREIYVAMSLPMNFDFRELSRLYRNFSVLWFAYRGYRLFSTVFIPPTSPPATIREAVFSTGHPLLPLLEKPPE